MASYLSSLFTGAKSTDTLEIILIMKAHHRYYYVEEISGQDGRSCTLTLPVSQLATKCQFKLTLSPDRYSSLKQDPEFQELMRDCREEPLEDGRIEIQLLTDDSCLDYSSDARRKCENCTMRDDCFCETDRQLWEGARNTTCNVFPDALKELLPTTKAFFDLFKDLENVAEERNRSEQQTRVREKKGADYNVDEEALAALKTREVPASWFN